MKKMLAVMALVAIAWAMLTAATTVNQGQTTNGVNQLDIVGGRISGTNTGQDLQFDSNGNLLTSGTGGIYRIEGTSLNLTDLAAKSVTKTITPVYVQDISKVTVLMSWAASDTDSVACEVFVVGKVSGNAADGADYLIDMNPSTRRLDGIRIGRNQRYFFHGAAASDSTNVNDYVWATNSAVNMQIYLGAGNGAKSTEPIAGVTLNQATSSAVCFPIAPWRWSAPPAFSYFSFWIANYTNSTLDDVVLQLIVKGGD